MCEGVRACARARARVRACVRACLRACVKVMPSTVLQLVGAVPLKEGWEWKEGHVPLCVYVLGCLCVSVSLCVCLSMCVWVLNRRPGNY